MDVNRTVFIETVRFAHGAPKSLGCHAGRMLRTLAAHSLPLPAAAAAVRRMALLAEKESSSYASGLFRATFRYDLRGDILSLDVIPYVRPRIERLRIFAADGVDYRYKYADRSALDAFSSRCADGEAALLTVGGLLADTTFTNIVCEDFDGRLLTPPVPLLCGTARRRLLHGGTVQTADIRPDDLCRFRRIHLINAMNDLGELTVCP